MALSTIAFLVYQVSKNTYHQDWVYRFVRLNETVGVLQMLSAIIYCIGRYLGKDMSSMAVPNFILYNVFCLLAMVFIVETCKPLVSLHYKDRVKYVILVQAILVILDLSICFLYVFGPILHYFEDNGITGGLVIVTYVVALIAMFSVLYFMWQSLTQFRLSKGNKAQDTASICLWWICGGSLLLVVEVLVVFAGGLLGPVDEGPIDETMLSGLIVYVIARSMLFFVTLIYEEVYQLIGQVVKQVILSRTVPTVSLAMQTRVNVT